MVKQQFVATAIPQGTIDISLTTLDNWSGHIPEVSILTSPLWTKSIQWTRDNLKPGNPIFDYFDEKLRAPRRRHVDDVRYRPAGHFFDIPNKRPQRL